MRNKELRLEIDRILWNEWDPIGVNDAAPRDEYSSYVAPVFDLLIKGADQEEIAGQLYYFETITMGLNGNKKRCRKIAGQILKFKK